MAFGDLWVNDYAPIIYKVYYGKSGPAKVYYGKSGPAKEFILNMDNVHKTVTQNILNSPI